METDSPGRPQVLGAASLEPTSNDNTPFLASDEKTISRAVSHPGPTARSITLPTVPPSEAAFRVKAGRSQYRISQDTAASKKNVRFKYHFAQTRLFFRSDPPSSLALKSASTGGGAASMGLTHSKHFQIGHKRRFCILNSARIAPSPSHPIRLERLVLPPAGKCIRGTAAVLNIAFQKDVAVLFTFDDWKSASYVEAGHRRSLHLGHSLAADLFGFNIDLENLPLETGSVLQVRARYKVLGQDFWDDNGGIDYQINLTV
jgi:hypothetical protein